MPVVTTNKENAMELAAHGEYSIEQKGNILFVDAHGPFNDVTAQLYAKDMYKVCSSFKGECWASLVTYYGNALYTPEAESTLIALTKYRAQHGMIANASIILDSNCGDIQHMQLRRIYQSANMTFHVFCDINSAEKWLVEFMNTHSQTKKAQ
jgi:hypothetical protein